MNNPALCIDVSKSSSFATGFLSYNKPYSKPFDFSHTPEGMKSTLHCLKELQIDSNSKPDVVLEATGNFYKPVTQYFIDLVLSIPGIGKVTAATILGEIGDISNFDTAKQLVAYAGLDPSVYQSGSFRAKNTKISKRGTPYLRKALF